MQNSNRKITSASPYGVGVKSHFSKQPAESPLVIHQLDSFRVIWCFMFHLPHAVRVQTSFHMSIGCT